ncbi:MAG: hypothetical protein ACOVNL_07040 [Prochlorococcaceae cyanobacterium]|jgi:hypothetical protein
MEPRLLSQPRRQGQHRIAQHSAVALPLAELGSPMTGFWLWLSEMVGHALGNPREEGLHQPPAVGVQPYRDRPRRRR